MSFGHRFLLFSIVLVAGLVGWTSAAEAATIRFNPSPAEVGLSETTDVQVVVSSNVSVNSAEVEISYPTDVVLAVEATAKGTVFPVTVFPPTRDNNTGRAKFTVAVTPPGYTGNSGVIGTISFKGQKLGAGKLRVVSAKVIANDGTGNNVYTGASEGDIVVNSSRQPQYVDTGDIGPVPVVTSTSHPDPSKWYKERNVSFAWEGGDVYSWVFDQSPDTIPPTVSMGPATTTVRGGVGDGVWYMHVRAAKGSTWGATTTVKVQVDGSPPPAFDLKFEPEIKGSSSSALPLISFETDGSQSGIDRYELSLDGGDWVVVRSPYQMPQVKPGKHTIEVKAIDKAGNETVARAELDVVPLSPKPTVSSPKSGATLAIGEDNEFKGKAPAGATVQLFANGQFVTSATANDKGEFSIKLNSQLKPGDYEFKVRAVKTGHLYSEFSDSIKAKVLPGGSGGLAIGGFVVPLWITLILYVVIILALVGGLIYLFIRWRKARRDQKLAMQKLELMTEADPTSEAPTEAAPIDTGVGQEQA